MIITSSANDRVKSLRRLYCEKKERDNTGLYIAEGVTIVKDLPREDIEGLFIKESKLEELSSMVKNTEYFVVKDTVFDGIADTKTPSGVIAVVKKRSDSTVDVGPTTVVLCGLSDCGNTGTIFRTACARGITTVFVVDGADPYAPKTVRAGMSAVSRLNIVQTDYDDVFRRLNDYDKIALDAGGDSIYDYQRKKKIAFFVGNEAHGVPDTVMDRCDRVLSLPMEKDSVESLNAAVAAGVAMYVVR
ncbi:MAG: RNA methyltransferase [Clostridia bacterium]|nr:RNA methyltransferase [Clostridia bacterium]